MKQAIIPILLVFALLAATAGDAGACSIPVFRYALERWRAEPYEIVVLHRGALSEDHQKIVAWLRENTEGFDARSNAEVSVVDLDGERSDGLTAPSSVEGVPESLRKLAADEGKHDLPRVILRYPVMYGHPEALWAGPLTGESAKALLDSPARRELGMRLLKGEAAVWVMVESGDRAKDDETAKFLGTQLAELEKTLKVSEIDPDDLMVEPGQAEDVPKLEVKFSVLRVSRKDASERALVAPLLRFESDLASDGEPVVFPVIGQGRALPPMVGAGIDKRNIAFAANFVVGPCSCIVKDQNPGIDLLMSVDWSALPDGKMVKPEPLPELTGVAAFAAPPAPAPAPETPAAITRETARPIRVAIAAALGALLAGIVIGTWAVLRKKTAGA